jgi:hypothetical protein
MLDAKREALKVAKRSVNRWTENVMALRDYCQAKFGISQEDFDKQFDIPADFDTV